MAFSTRNFDFELHIDAYFKKIIHILPMATQEARTKNVIHFWYWEFRI